MADNTIYNITEDPFNAGSFSSITGRNPETYTVSNAITEHPAINGFQLQDRPDMATLRLIVYELGDTFDTDTDEVELEIITAGVPNYVQALVDSVSGWVHLHADRVGQDVTAFYDSYGSNYNVSNVTGIVTQAVGTAVTDAVATAIATVETTLYQSIYDRTQMVIQGSVDANGKADFLKISGTSVYMDATPTPVTILFAAGISSGRKVTKAVEVQADYSPAEWTGLTTNGTYYLYVDNNSGVLTAGKHTTRHKWATVEPASAVTTDGYYNISNSTEYYYTGSVWSPIERYYVGRVVVSGGVPTEIRTYALNGRAVIETAVAAATNYTLYHDIGVAVHEGLDVQWVYGLDSAFADSSVAHDIWYDNSVNHYSGHYNRENVANSNTDVYVKFGFSDHTQTYKGSTSLTTGYYRIIAERNF